MSQVKKIVKGSRILIVEDDPDGRRIIELKFKKEGYKNLSEAECGQDALDLLIKANKDGRPYHLVILDLVLPDIDGFELCKTIKTEYDTPVIIVTGLGNKADQLKGLELGADDFIVKPFDNDILYLKAEKVMTEKYLTMELEQSNFQNKKMFLNILQVIAKILEAKDPYTQFHSENVAKYSRRIAKKLGFGKEQINILGIAGILHDVGKIGVQEAVLNKRCKLTESEREIVKKHSTIAATVLEPIDEFKVIINDIRHHHEKYDGTGYPDGLHANRIPLGARIICLVDAYDAMTSGRAYQKARKKDDAIEEIRRCAGTHFDPDLVEIFVEVLNEEHEEYEED